MATHAPPLRSLLFVPGDSERKQAKAVATSADALIFDLEDSVAPARLDLARQLVRARLLSKKGNPADQAWWVRVNPPSSAAFSEDLAAIADAAPSGLVLPKVSALREVLEADRQLSAVEQRAKLAPGSIRLIVIATETPQAMFALGEYRTAVDRLDGLTWGSEDLATALGMSSQFEDDGSLSFTLRLTRSMCLLAAAAANVQAIDTVHVDFRDSAGLAHAAAAARRDGFTGKLAIHPDQIEVIHAAFTPSAAEVERARKIVAAFAASPDAGVLSLDGRMLDRPHLLQAQRILALAERGEVSFPLL